MKPWASETPFPLTDTEERQIATVLDLTLRLQLLEDLLLSVETNHSTYRNPSKFSSSLRHDN